MLKNIANLPDTQEQLVSYVYKEAVSPHLAARKEGNPVELTKVKADFEAACARHEFIFAEGSGGIICPIRYDVGVISSGDKSQKIFLEDIIKTVNLPILVVTTAALGSINACVLTVEYVRLRIARFQHLCTAPPTWRIRWHVLRESLRFRCLKVAIMP